MIRISGGRFRGRQIHCPKGKEVRPTTAFVRESLFSILGPQIQEARFLDLFAGCGIVGVEALSRGASSVTAVERAAAHCRLLEKNREHLGLASSEYEVLCQDVFTWASRLPERCPEHQQKDVVYLDPPYALTGVDAVVAACFQHHLLSSYGVLIWETAAQVSPKAPPGVVIADQRRYGTSMLSFFKYLDPES